MGKRVNRSARTVIGPDPTLKITEIAIPRRMSEILTHPMIVNRLNINNHDTLNTMVNNINGLCNKN